MNKNAKHPKEEDRNLFNFPPNWVGIRTHDNVPV